MEMVVSIIANIVTLGLVALALYIYHYKTKDNRALDKVRNYVGLREQQLQNLGKDLCTKVENVCIDLKVEKQSAVELLNRLKALSEQELAQKANMLTQIDEKLRSYDASMQELKSMAERVQENMNRIREESAFVENAGKRVNDAKEKIELVEKNIGAIGLRFEKENTAALEKFSRDILLSVRSTVSDIETNAGIIDRKVEEHRHAVEKIEQERAATIAKEMERINKVLKDSFERATAHADKIEDAAFVKLREQAQERVNQFKATWEEKVKTTQEAVKARLTEIQEMVKNKTFEIQENVKTKSLEIQEELKESRNGWKAGLEEVEAQQKTVRDEWKKELQELDALIRLQKDQWSSMSRETEERILSVSNTRLEEYQKAQEEVFNQLENLSKDAAQLESELRHSMDDTVARVNDDFASFESESQKEREAVSKEFELQMQKLRSNLDGVEQELAGLRNQAKENVLEKLNLFEKDFYADLAKRSTGIESCLTEWQDAFQLKIADIAREGEEGRKQAELRLSNEQRASIAELGEKLLSNMERLRTQASAFEEGIREGMRAADESQKSLCEQMERNLEDARSFAEAQMRSQIGQYSLSMSEAIRQNQRDLEEQLKEIVSRTDAHNAELEAAVEAARNNVQDWQNQYNVKAREMEASVEEIRRHIREASADTDEQATRIRGEIDVVKKELSEQSKLFDRAGERKLALERSIEDLNGNIDRLEQRKSEVALMESHFQQIKRLEEEVNNKMTIFLAEKRRIEFMEKDFIRLIEISQSVEEKLAQVTSSDDVLQTVQVQIRRLEDSIRDADEKYQRIEQKGQVLDETRDGIGQNFKALQESEAAVKKLNEDMMLANKVLQEITDSIKDVAAESKKAQDAADKLATLDENISFLEKRIAEMQVAREWVARTETELNDLYQDAEDQLKLTRSLLNKEGGVADTSAKQPQGKSLSIRDRESIIKLRSQGWSKEEIARSKKISIGEVELVLELGVRG